MKFCEQLYLDKTANGCFFLFLEACVYAKITDVTWMENCFTNSPPRISSF